MTATMRYTVKTIPHLMLARGVDNTSALAEATGIHREHLAQIKNGRRVVRTRGNLGRPSEAQRLATYFGLSVDTIVSLSNATVRERLDREAKP